MTDIMMIGIDGDDTLWHSEGYFAVTQERFADLLADYLPPGEAGRRLFDTELRNLHLFGYGVKGFTLSMIETAIEATGGRVPAVDVQTILEWGREMLAHPIDLLDGAGAAVADLAGSHPLALVTMGDLFHQESKVAQSGLADVFEHVEIVSLKSEATYLRMLDRLDVDPAGFVMVGNSPRSDVLPVIAIGGRAVHVPYQVTWAHQDAPVPETDRFRQLDHIGALPDLIRSW